MGDWLLLPITTWHAEAVKQLLRPRVEPCSDLAWSDNWHRMQPDTLDSNNLWLICASMQPGSELMSPHLIMMPPGSKLRNSNVDVVVVQGQLLWRGPRVRMGLFEGQPVAVSAHPASGRADYWGVLCNR